MERMFGFFPELPSEVEQLLITLSRDLAEVKEKMEGIPAETLVGVDFFGKTLLDQMVGVNHTVEGFEALFLDRGAAGEMLNFFGVPKTPLAVPIFKSLVNNLEVAQEASRLGAEKLGFVIKNVQYLLGAVAALAFDKEIASASQEQELCGKAELELASVVMNENLGIKVRATQGASSIKSRGEFLKNRVFWLKKQKETFLKFSKNLGEGGAEALNVTNTTFFLDPAKAL